MKVSVKRVEKKENVTHFNFKSMYGKNQNFVLHMRLTFTRNHTVSKTENAYPWKEQSLKLSSRKIKTQENYTHFNFKWMNGTKSKIFLARAHYYITNDAVTKTANTASLK